MVTISELKTAKEEQFDDMCRLLQQLHGERASTYAAPVFSQLVEQVSDKRVVTVVALDGERVVGMALLFILARTGESSGMVEDVVVDDQYRGQGIGTLLMNRIVEVGRRAGLRQLELTSKPTREAANHIYKKVGFEKRETNVYRLRF